MDDREKLLTATGQGALEGEVVGYLLAGRYLTGGALKDLLTRWAGKVRAYNAHKLGFFLHWPSFLVAGGWEQYHGVLVSSGAWEAAGGGPGPEGPVTGQCQGTVPAGVETMTQEEVVESITGDLEAAPVEHVSRSWTQMAGGTLDWAETDDGPVFWVRARPNPD